MNAWSTPIPGAMADPTEVPEALALRNRMAAESMDRMVERRRDETVRAFREAMVRRMWGGGRP